MSASRKIREVAAPGKVDLNHFPEQCGEFKSGDDITIGDLHGNVMKLIFTLVKEGVIELSKADYKELLELYRTPIGDFYESDFKRFSEIIDDIVVHCPEQGKVRLIGDDLADRGLGDHFTLYFLKKLHKANLQFEILHSNHGAEFLLHYQDADKNKNKENLFPFTIEYESQRRSLTNLLELEEYGVIDSKKINEIVNDVYFQHGKFISYSVIGNLHDENAKLIVYTHAPVYVKKIIEEVAKEYKIEVKEGNAKELAETIDKINEEVMKDIKNPQILNEIMSSKNKDHPIFKVAWNRSVEKEMEKNDYPFVDLYAHGHSGPLGKEESVLSFRENMLNLDGSNFGKGPINNTGCYFILNATRTPDYSLRQSQQQQIIGEIRRDLRETLNNYIRELNEYLQKNKIIQNLFGSDSSWEECAKKFINEEKQYNNLPDSFQKLLKKYDHLSQLQEIVRNSKIPVEARLNRVKEYIQKPGVRQSIEKGRGVAGRFFGYSSSGKRFIDRFQKQAERYQKSQEKVESQVRHH